MSRIKKRDKGKPEGKVQAVDHRKSRLRFSFEFFDSSDPEVCPECFRDGFVQSFVGRLKNLSKWTVLEFFSERSPALRAHPIDWEHTSRPKGFSALPSGFDSGTPYQFALSANAHGRVHGFMVGDTFHVVWLDHDHAVYPGAD